LRLLNSPETGGAWEITRAISFGMDFPGPPILKAYEEIVTETHPPVGRDTESSCKRNGTARTIVFLTDDTRRRTGKFTWLSMMKHWE